MNTIPNYDKSGHLKEEWSLSDTSYTKSDIIRLIYHVERLIDRYPKFRDDPDREDIMAWDEVEDSVKNVMSKMTVETKQ